MRRQNDSRAERNSKLTAYYLTPHTAEETAEKFGLTVNGVFYLLQRLGVTIRRAPSERYVWSAERVEMLTTLWLEGIPTADIGARLGTSDMGVVGKARRLDLPLRHNSYTAQRLRPHTEISL